MKFLIDTGAAISVLSAAFLQKIPLALLLKLDAGQLHTVNTVSGEQLPVQGKVYLPLSFEQNTYNCEACVIGNLGYDFVL